VFEIGIQILFYLTPVLYRPDGFGEVGRLGMMIQYNPLTSVLEMVRRPMLTGEMPTAFSVWVSLGFTAVVGVLAVFCLRKLERTLVFWL